MQESAQIAKDEPAYFYDATTGQRYEYLVEENGEEFETAHNFCSNFNSDELYLDWVRSWHIKSRSDGEADERYSDATATFWDNCIEKVENFEMQGDWKSKVPADEKIEAMHNLLAVAIATNPAKNKVRSGIVSDEQTIITEAFFNGIKSENTCQQKHILTNSNRQEWRKKYQRILAKRTKPEKIGGLRRKPNIIFVPQDEAIGKLYDEMFIAQDGFNQGIIPLRFKTTVIQSIFDSRLDEKK